MKNKYLSLLALVLLTFACTKPDDILDDFQVHISPTFYKYVVEIDVEDLTNPGDEITSEINVSLTGPDAAAVYNIDGTKNFKVNFGTLQLMVSKDAEPTPGNPLDFVVRFEANGYKNADLSFAIAEEDYYVADLARMLNLSTLPSSIGNTSANGGIDPNTNQLAQPLVVKAGSPDSLAKINITIPTDVKFLDADGNEIVGKRGGTGLNVNVLSLSDTSEASQQAYPNGTGLMQLVMNDGKIDTILLDQTGSYEINMDLDGTPVRGFSGGKTSGGVSTRIPIPADAWNDEFSRAYQEGDSVGMMSLSDGDPSWEIDDRSFLVKKDPGTGELYVEPTLNHLSWWRWRRRRWWRPTYYRHGIGAYYSPGTQANAGAVSGRIRGRFSYYRWGRRYSCYLYIRGNFGPNFRTNPKRYFRTTSPYNPAVFDYTTFSTATYNLTNEAASWFGYNFRVLKIEPKVQPPSIGYRLYCGSSNTLVSPPAGVKMYYRKHNSGTPFTHLYTFTNENLGVTYATFPALENNEYYDFQARFNDVQKDTLNVKVVDGRIYDVVLPNRACNALGL